MAYSELDRVYVRKFLGFSAIFLQGDPRLENALNATQSIADNGVRPDSNTENAIKALLYGQASQAGTNGVTLGPAAQNTTFQVPARPGLVNIKNALDGLIPISFVLFADQKEIEIDPARGASILRRMGREMVAELADVLSTPPRFDVFGTRRYGHDPETEGFMESIGLGGHNAGGESPFP